MKRTVLALVLLSAAAGAPAQGPAAAPVTAAAAARIEERREKALEEVAALAARRLRRYECVLYPVNRRGLPAFGSTPRGELFLDLTVQVDLAAYRAWVSELGSPLRRLALEVEQVRLVREPAGFRFELPGREFSAEQFVVVDGFANVPKALSGHVYTFDIATAAAVRAAFRPPREKKDQGAVLLQFRKESAPAATVRMAFAPASGPEILAPFVEASVRYQLFRTGGAAVKHPVLVFKSRKPLRASLSKIDTETLRGMTAAWTAYLPQDEADAAEKTGFSPYFRDARGRFVKPLAAVAATAAAADETPEPAVSAASAAAEEDRRRAAEARALRLRADAATADAVRGSAAAFFDSVRAGAKGREAASAVESFSAEDLSTACVEAVREAPGAPALALSGEAYLAAQLWAKWRMRATEATDGSIVPGKPVWTLAPAFRAAEYVRGAARVKAFPALSLEDSGAEPEPEPVRTGLPSGFWIVAAAAVVLTAGTGVLLWIEHLRRAAEAGGPGGDAG